MKRSLKPLLRVALALALLALGAGGGWWWAQRSPNSPPMAGAAPAGAAQQGERKVLYWYDPMYPQQHFDKPGKSPFMDMALVPKYADEDTEAAGVKIDPGVAQNLGLRLAKVERIARVDDIEATGLIGFDERNVAIVQPRSGGFVERVWPLAPGDLVRAGQPLVEILVPEWAAAQHELLAVRASGDAALLAAARERLRLLGMPERLIAAVERSGAVQSRYTLAAPIGGVIQTLDVRAGMTLSPGQTLARINGLATVWLEVALPQAQAARIGVGDRATARIAGVADPVEGRVFQILPMLQDATRTLRVRIALPNRDAHLRPGMVAQVALRGAQTGTALAVPTEAVIRTGKRALVMLATAPGRYTPVEVSLGEEIGDRTVITGGLAEGQQVVASGLFLLDSEARLSGIAPQPATPPSGPVDETEATIEDIAADGITLAHGPLRNIGMPGMTMSFPLARPDLARGLKVGDRVRVTLRQTDDGLVVERIAKAGGAP